MILGQEFTVDFQISEKIYSGFINIFDDRNALHISDEYARSKGFESRVMHGNILCGFLSRFVGELLPVENTVIHSIAINFRNPCYLEEVVTLKARVEEVHESVSVYVFKFSFIIGSRTAATGNLQIGLLK
ncbi:hypothetical protein F6R98_01045 [Candidatus Methylospira mobilis]|uniref:MaoC-like domain-containing protein n=1 Tax=Candidatus Methylospira mobilis TaxID=1808979 RepID=A0A5Q0BE25_9GAMM|nr:MaoC/PaaZ C-terminal domain-containing protein [Candidatus Methylospira mobilis]QFY41382.1 hypothetical protein F6R98_01045 [Candidatus Methylospira mobilis]